MEIQQCKDNARYVHAVSHVAGRGRYGAQQIEYDQHHADYPGLDRNGNGNEHERDIGKIEHEEDGYSRDGTDAPRSVKVVSFWVIALVAAEPKAKHSEPNKSIAMYIRRNSLLP